VWLPKKGNAGGRVVGGGKGYGGGLEEGVGQFVVLAKGERGG